MKMQINGKLLVLTIAIVAIATGMMSTSNAQESRKRQREDYQENRDRRGWLGMKRNPNERHGIIPNILGVPQDVGEDLVGRGGDRGRGRRYDNRQSNRDNRQQEMQRD